MKSAALAAIACAALALPVAASAPAGGNARSGDRLAAVIVGAATMREAVRSMAAPSTIDNASSAGGQVATDARAVPNRLPTVSMTVGEVRKVDETVGKLTLRHAGLENLDIPPMTMVFRVRDPGWLLRLQVGDKVRFHAERVDGNLTITALEREPEGAP